MCVTVCGNWKGAGTSFETEYEAVSQVRAVSCCSVQSIKFVRGLKKKCS